ncbi:MAG: flagellar biosynthesis protein FlhB [Rhodothermales bacterium]
MSDGPDKHEKVFDPTPQRIKKAREDGNVMRSREIVSVGMLIIGLSVMAGGAPFAFGVLKALAASLFQGAASTTVNQMSTPSIFMYVGSRLMVIILPFSLALMAAAVSLNVMQSGWNMAPKALEPKASRLNLIEGIKRLFSSKGLFDFGKSLAKILVVGPIAYMTISGRLPKILMLHTLPIESILKTAGGWILILIAQMLLVLLLLSGIDFAFEKYRYKKDLMMSAKELKDEAKESEGDPQIKVRRRQIAREMLRRPRMDHAVLQADVVVTNPTHYAVALHYDPEESPAPRVLVKGIRKRALRIKELAAEYEVPMIEDRPLARALYNTVEEDQEIPEELYPAVATILAEVYRRRDT